MAPLQLAKQSAKPRSLAPAHHVSVLARSLMSEPIISQISKTYKILSLSASRGTRAQYDATTLGLERVMWVSCTLLMSFGLLAIYAASSMKGLHQFDDSYYFVRTQLLISVFGAGWLLASRKIPPRLWEILPLPLYVLVLLLLAAVWIPGAYSDIGGARRWLNAAGLRFQVGELAKLALILILAKNIARPSYRTTDFWKSTFPGLALFVLYAVFLMAQPDFGTTALLASVCGAILTMAGMPLRVIMGFGVAMASLAATLVMIAPYRLKRILVFLDPWTQIRGGGFQIIQSYLGFQNGGLWGRGLGESKQKLFFLPEAHTDFILSVIGEELGLVAVLFLLVCYLSLIFCAFRIAQKQRECFWYFSALGITLLLSCQTIMNMGVVMGLLPTKGIPLPFISKGMSSLVTFLLMMAFLFTANRRYPIKKPRSQDA